MKKVAHILQYKVGNDADIATLCVYENSVRAFSAFRLVIASGGGHCHIESFVENRCVG